MIISRTPLRISLGGGGTDLPGYYRAHSGGFLVAAAITKYVYVAVHPNFEPSILLKYSLIENVDKVSAVKHPLIREALDLVGIQDSIEISSMADIPAGTGLGSSGTFTVGLLRALYTFLRRYVGNEELAAKACHLEIERLREPIGKQDQFIAAVGGITSLEFRPDDSVVAESVPLGDDLRSRLEENLLLFYTGVRRSASEELRALDEGTSMASSDLMANLDSVKEIGRTTFGALVAGDEEGFASLLTEQWRLKFARSRTAMHEQVDRWILTGLDAGAMGGKLVGAGGGGFLLFYAQNKTALRVAMEGLGLREVTFGIDYLGSTVVVQ